MVALQLCLFPSPYQRKTFFSVLPTVDTEPPVIANCPASPLTFQNEISDRHILANWTAPTATDNSGQVVLVDKSDKSPGQFIYVGDSSVTSVTYVFEDGSHNQAFCSFDIHIQSGNYIVVPWYYSRGGGYLDQGSAAFTKIGPNHVVASIKGQ